MKSIYCENTFDITLILSRQETRDLKRTNQGVHVLDAENKGLVFHIMNSSTAKGIQVKEPTNPSVDYWIKIDDSTYDSLLKNGNCGDRYQGASKINVVMNDELA